MPSKYEILASVIKREHDNLAEESHYIDDGSWQVLLHVLSILHHAEEGPRPGGPNNPIDWEGAADAIYSQIAFNHVIIDFDRPAPYEREFSASDDDLEQEMTTARDFTYKSTTGRVGGSDELDFGGGDTA